MGGGFRSILDLRGLNSYLKHLPFCMLCIKDVMQAVTPHEWFTSVDLKDTYFHVPIVQEHGHFLRFAFQGMSIFVLHPSIQPLFSSSCVHTLRADCLRSLAASGTTSIAIT